MINTKQEYSLSLRDIGELTHIILNYASSVVTAAAADDSNDDGYF
jgi:hypothetical protein